MAWCPFVQWQDSGLWSHESWFESKRGNPRQTLGLTKSLSHFSLQGSGMDGLAVPAHGFKLLAGTGNRPLAEEIARQLGIDLCKLTLTRFADGEIFVRIDENVRGNDVFIVQPTNAPAENIMELLLLIDAARRASSARSPAGVCLFCASCPDREG